MITSPLRQYFRIRKVVVDGEPDARRVEMHVGVQTVSIGPDYVEDLEHAEFYITAMIQMIKGAVSGLCNACYGEGWTEEGDPESGSCPMDCTKCGGKGFTNVEGLEQFSHSAEVPHK